MSQVQLSLFVGPTGLPGSTCSKPSASTREANARATCEAQFAHQSVTSCLNMAFWLNKLNLRSRVLKSILRFSKIYQFAERCSWRGHPRSRLWQACEAESQLHYFRSGPDLVSSCCVSSSLACICRRYGKERKIGIRKTRENLARRRSHRKQGRCGVCGWLA